MATYLKLTVSVWYDRNGTPVDEIAHQLNRAAEHLADEGLLSGCLDAVVTDWSRNVDIVQIGEE